MQRFNAQNYLIDRINRFSITAVIISLVFFNHSVFAESDVVSTTDDQSMLSLTIYNNNLAFIRDTRALTLQKGNNNLSIEGISANIKPESAILHSKEDNGSITTLEQSFNYDLLTPKLLLDKYVGKDITIVRIDPVSNEEKHLSATVLSTNGGIVLKVGNNIEIGMPEKIKFPALPENLFNKPTLVIELENNKSSLQELELSYLTHGLQWQADYIASLNKQEDTIDLQALVTINNQTGASYEDAELQLIAGDINQVNKNIIRRSSAKLMSRSIESLEHNVQAEAISDLYLYSLPRKTNLRQNQSKQVTLFTKSSIPVKKDYVFEGKPYYYYQQFPEIFENIKATTKLTLHNKESHNLGIPLPKGVVRSYKKDANNKTQFIGEDKIDHIAVEEKFSLNLGKAFDITASKKQVEFNKLSSLNNRDIITESSYEIEIQNSKNSAIHVNIIEPIPGDWQILETNFPHRKVQANQAEWEITLAGKEKILLQYRVHIKQ